jgi:uncharacterized damage-inducible protein DinB
MNRLKDLYLHMHWADAAVWDAVLGSDTAAGDTRIADLFYHLHSVQRAFFAIWTSAPIAMPKREHFVSLQQLADWGRTYHTEVLARWSEFTPEMLEAGLSIPWSRFMEQRYGRKAEGTSMEESMHQVLLHTMHHRGQIVARLRELGAEPPMIDYIGWIWLGRPDPEWK